MASDDGTLTVVANGANPYGPKWNDTHYVTAYELAKQGHSDRAIAKALGVAHVNFVRWKCERPALRDALARGREVSKPGTQGGSFKDYVYNRLSPHLKELWDEVMRCAEAPTGVARLDALFHENKRARQHLFLYAYTSSNFNMSHALHRLGLSKNVVEQWCKEPEFAALLDEMHWHKQNFFEEALIQRVAAGSDACTIFANKTMNRDRYPERISVEVSGTVNHTLAVVPVEALDTLPLTDRLRMLDALRKHLDPPTIDAAILPAPALNTEDE